MRFFFFVIFVTFMLITAAVILVSYHEKPKLPVTPKSFSSLSPSSSPTSSSMKVKVSIPYWDQETAIKSFKENANVVDYISLFWYFLDNEGKIKKYKYANEDLSLINFANTEEHIMPLFEDKKINYAILKIDLWNEEELNKYNRDINSSRVYQYLRDNFEIIKAMTGKHTGRNAPHPVYIYKRINF